MTNERLYVVHGMGKDAVGLVGRIATPIARAGGNIVDLRQDVLHGLFTIYMVVDLRQSNLELPGFESMIANIGDDTGLKITVDPFAPVPRGPDKRNLLMILIGRDRPGIIASSCEMLGKYRANIEFAQTIAREGIFLMELLTDVSHATIPVENLKRTISKTMEAFNIKTIYQDEQVFLKRKRIILFRIASSFFKPDVLREILQQTGVPRQELAGLSTREPLLPSLQLAASKLEGLPLDVLDTVLPAMEPSAGSLELIQTLKVMGYKIALASTGLSFFTDYLRDRLDIDYAFGVPCAVDDDARSLLGELDPARLSSHDMDAVVSQLVSLEGVDPDDITIITDEGCGTETPGIRLDWKLEVLLNCFNQHIISQDNLIGLLAGFGIPSVS